MGYTDLLPAHQVYKANLLFTACFYQSDSEINRCMHKLTQLLCILSLLSLSLPIIELQGLQCRVLSIMTEGGSNSSCVSVA